MDEKCILKKGHLFTEDFEEVFCMRWSPLRRLLCKKGIQVPDGNWLYLICWIGIFECSSRKNLICLVKMQTTLFILYFIFSQKDDKFQLTIKNIYIQTVGLQWNILYENAPLNFEQIKKSFHCTGTKNKQGYNGAQMTGQGQKLWT